MRLNLVLGFFFWFSSFYSFFFSFLKLKKKTKMFVFFNRCQLSGSIMLLQAISGDSGHKATPGTQQDADGTQTHILDYAPAPGWTVHVTKEGRLYYCK